MQGDGALQSFVLELNREVADRVEGEFLESGHVYSETAFTEFVAEQLTQAGVMEDFQACYHEGVLGRGYTKISGYSINEEFGQLDLVVTVFTNQSEVRTVPREDIRRAAERAARFFEGAASGRADQMEPSTDAAELAHRIATGPAAFTQLRVLVLTDGVVTAWDMKGGMTAGVPTSFDVWDLVRLQRATRAELGRHEIDVNLEEMLGGALPCLPMPEDDKDYDAYLAIVPAELLFRLYDSYGPRLLELNVRSFLSLRNKVNKGMRETIRTEPARFLAYNNGIVATVDELELTRLPDGQPAIKSFKGLQIVNGGQTTATIHYAARKDGADLSLVSVPAKINRIHSDSLDQMVASISACANRQSAVQEADLSANHPFHVEVEKLSRSIWCPGHQSRWFYERARGQYQVAKSREGTTRARVRRFNQRTPTKQKFTKTDLAKYEHAWDQKPHFVSMGAQKNFIRFMSALKESGRGSGWEPDAQWYRSFIAKAIIFRGVQRVVRQEKFPAHQANITAYTVAYLSSAASSTIRLNLIWEEQDLSPELKVLLRGWVHKVDTRLRETAGNRMVTEWAKREDCWQALRRRPLPLPEPLPPELLGSNVTGGPSAKSEPSSTASPEDYRRIERCKGLTGDQWLAISGWGEKTGELERWQIGIARTLAGYASAGWQKVPSVKQARQGVKIIETAVDAGVVSPA